MKLEHIAAPDYLVYETRHAPVMARVSLAWRLLRGKELRMPLGDIAIVLKPAEEASDETSE